MGINQCEKEGTSARVAKYKPNNISMLCAFIAAIRPGFKSMYKIFESKQPFSYNVKAFDDLIQTEEMPMSFVLYQEQEMAALNYAGISMSECYTAIKNIAKKRKEKVLAYHDVFINGFNKAMIENEGKTPEEASKLSSELWQIIEDSASYSFNASHSYCVALDSLYGAWLKSHHPIAFYECFMQIQEEKGAKDKINKAKDEAEDYYNVKFPPYRFGQDNRQITGDIEANSINNALSSIKNYSNNIAEILYECSLEEHKTFMDVMKWLDKRSIKTAKVQPLIKIDYFMRFGNCVELLRINEMFDFFAQGTAKSIKKEKIKSEILENIISRHATDKKKDGSEAKSYTITDIDSILNEVEAYIKSLNLDDLSFKLKCANHNEILGYIDLTTNREEDRQKLVVSKVIPVKNKTTGEQFAYMLVTKSIGSGKNGSINVMRNVFDANPISENDVIFIRNRNTDMYKNQKGYWYLRRYEKIVV
jgi:DNA polymerase III alpha subunit